LSSFVGIPPALSDLQSYHSVPFISKFGLPAPSLLTIQPITQLIPARISYYDSYASFSHNFLQFAISVPNFLTIFIVVFGDISVNLYSIRLILGLLYSKYLQQCFLVLLLRSSRFISYLSSTALSAVVPTHPYIYRSISSISPQSHLLQKSGLWSYRKKSNL